jgi:hypothetical protein
MAAATVAVVIGTVEIAAAVAVVIGTIAEVVTGTVATVVVVTGPAATETGVAGKPPPPPSRTPAAIVVGQPGASTRCSRRSARSSSARNRGAKDG